MNDWTGLADLVGAQLAEAEVWQTAELHLLERAFVERLAEAGIAPTPEAAATMMVAAMLLAEHAPEWGGDTRDALAEVAALGLRLLEHCDGA